MAEDPEKAKARNARYRIKNRDKIRVDYKNWYHNNKERARATIKKCNIKRKAELRAIVNALKTPCKRCGITDIRVIDFHHIDPATKRFTIANAVCDKRPTQDILDEIKKCETLCANCHRIEHYKNSSNEI